MTRFALTLLALSLTFASSVLAATEDDDVPVAPIAPVVYEGWTNALRLANEKISLVVIPDTGRIAAIAYGQGENMLRMDPALKGKTALLDAPDYWFNFGGDWLWPVAQERWPDFQAGDWPPSRLLDGRPWQARAWKCADGSDCCKLTQVYGAPLHIEVSRFIKLDKEEAEVEIRQRIERTADSDIPVTLWNISQVAQADRVVLPTDEDSAFENGLAILKFGAPDEKMLARCETATTYDASLEGEHKLGSDSPRAWIAAQKGEVLLVEHVRPHDAEASYPDGGCTVEMYSNSGLGYTEIETLSAEKNLRPGEVLENTLTFHCYQLIKPDLPDCELADKVRELIGEKKPEPALAPTP